jgi:ariadne-1
MPVVRELVDAAAAGEDRARYDMFVVRSFVEEGTSKYVRWCPGPGCTLAVRSEPGYRVYEVECKCKHVFCFRCGEDTHRPASCETARAWADKCRSDGENSSWVLANTKHCPKCRRAIEKNDGCNHMTCGAPCYHQFCWLCLGSWANHSGDNFHCNRYAADKSEFTGDKTRERQARASLERFLHYYERWTAHGESMEKARRDLDGLRDGGGLEELAGVTGQPTTELVFITEAYERIVKERRVLRWTYAHVYHLDPELDNVEFCEYLQGEAANSLERLHHCTERDRDALKKDLEYYGGATPAGYAAGKYTEFREKLSHLNLVTRNHFSRLVEGFESGMAKLARCDS